MKSVLGETGEQMIPADCVRHHYVGMAGGSGARGVQPRRRLGMSKSGARDGGSWQSEVGCRPMARLPLEVSVEPASPVKILPFRHCGHLHITGNL